MRTVSEVPASSSQKANAWDGLGATSSAAREVGEPDNQGSRLSGNATAWVVELSRFTE